MSPGTISSVIVFLTTCILALGQTVPADQPASESVAKLIAQLGAKDFRVREQGSKELEKLGSAILPALRRAAKGKIELEVKRRLEGVITRIETAALKAEEKHWQKLDASRRGVKDKLVQILAKKPELKDQQLISAIYLLTMARYPTDDEATRGKKQFTESTGRLIPALGLARSLVQTKEFNADVAAVIGRIRKFNFNEVQKLCHEIGASLSKAAKTNEQLVDVAFLLVFSRFPEPKQSNIALDHLKKHAKNRAEAAGNIIWALINTKEFLMSANR
jgi:hypothetical protein